MLNPAKPLSDLSREEIRLTFGETIYLRGLSYFRDGRVKECSIDEHGTLRATVKGSEYEPYFVVIRPMEGSEKDLEASCTCPYEYGCKHQVAALLSIRERYASKPDDAMKEEPVPPAVKKWLGRITEERTSEVGKAPGSRDCALYILKPCSAGVWKLELQVSRLLLDGSWGAPRPSNTMNTARGNPAKFLTQADINLYLEIAESCDYYGKLEGLRGRRILEDAIATRRCYIDSKDGKRAVLGPKRTAKGRWEAEEDGSQHFVFMAEPAGRIMVLDGLWYVDEATGEVGQAEADLDIGTTLNFIESPKVAAVHSSEVRDQIARRFPDRPDLWPKAFSQPIALDIVPTPVLRLELVQLSEPWGVYGVKKKNPRPHTLSAKTQFRYRNELVDPGNQTRIIKSFENGQAYRIPRRFSDEDVALSRLGKLGFARTTEAILDHGYHFDFYTRGLVLLDADRKLPDWDGMADRVSRFVPELRGDGWEVEVDGRLMPVDFDAGDWEAEVEESSGMDWFSLNLGVIVDGEKFDLKPILLRFLTEADEEDRKWLAKAKDTEQRSVPLGDGRYARIAAGRARTIIQTLKDLFSLSTADEIPVAAASGLSDLAACDWLTWRGGASVKGLASRLRNFQGITGVKAPKGLKATLRPYQLEGLSWLSFLGEFGLGGVLADDMGLGKTIQTLAHMVAEKEARRLEGPCLVVAPTSLLTNWKAETAKWTPKLSMLTLHGPDRNKLFGKIKKHDVVLTTYPLLARDQEALLAHEFGLIVLDEAQNIKNPKAAVTQTACRLRSKRRLCLTGTPMENHLGELWSIYRFLMPGFLGSEAQFKKVFRTPIENHGDAEAREILRKRIKPFMLRRTKNEVAKELPAKTELLESIELEGAQRDLYETVRLAMHQRVREAIQAKGVAKSHILVLDALLKLRQICCDPRLMKTESTKKPPGSAKLDRLLEMLPELIDEGSRILLFSQFTSMLDLIETELGRLAIPFVKLTGRTVDRATPISRFQNGEVPLFLISLKAGGTGLNLTAADTVIHYDPWWNPAVETQATDRAHRIGQDKPVFVYKLITSGTVEEKITQLQDRKRELVGSLLDGGGKAGLQLTAEDLDMLFKPL